MEINARQALDLRMMQPGIMLPAPFHAMSTADLKARAEREEAAERKRQQQEGAAEAPAAVGVDPIDRALQRGRPKRPTPARLKTYFLRVFERCGSQSEAAARAGVTPRTVQRWRTTDPRFAERYDEIRARRVELLEDLALQRASGRMLEPRFYHGKQVATVERMNDRLLMRVLARFDQAGQRETRAREVELATRNLEDEVDRRVLDHQRKLNQADERYRKRLDEQFEERVAKEVQKRISEMSLSARQ